MSESEKDNTINRLPSPDPAVSTEAVKQAHRERVDEYLGADPAVSVERATADLKRAALEWEGESYDEAVAPAVQALIAAVRAECGQHFERQKQLLAVRAASPRIREEPTTDK